MLSCKIKDKIAGVLFLYVMIFFSEISHIRLFKKFFLKGFILHLIFLMVSFMCQLAGYFWMKWMGTFTWRTVSKADCSPWYGWALANHRRPEKKGKDWALCSGKNSLANCLQIPSASTSPRSPACEPTLQIWTYQIWTYQPIPLKEISFYICTYSTVCFSEKSRIIQSVCWVIHIAKGLPSVKYEKSVFSSLF